MMKNFVLLMMIVMMSTTVWAEGKQIVYRHSAKHPDGTVYYSAKPIDGAIMKTTKLEWNKFAVMYPKSWICTKEAGWMLVDTPKAIVPDGGSQPVTIPRYIPPIRNFGSGRIVIVTPTISKSPSKK